jgi:hypothetical protein
VVLRVADEQLAILAGDVHAGVVHAASVLRRDADVGRSVSGHRSPLLSVAVPKESAGTANS